MELKFILLAFGVYAVTTTAIEKRTTYQSYLHKKRTPITSTTTTDCVPSRPLVTLYKLIDNSNFYDDTFYTTSDSKVFQYMDDSGYKKQQSPGLVASTADVCSTCGVNLVPVYNLESTVEFNRYYTTSETEVTAFEAMEYERLDNVFYCANEQNACGASIPKILTGYICTPQICLADKE